MKKTVVLLRVSTDMQETIAQKTAINDFVIKNKIVVDDWVEEDGVSGFKTKLEDRKGLMEIKDMALAGELDTLIIFNSDRIGRRMEMVGFMSLLDECKVKVISITEGILNKGEDTDSLISSIKFWMAEYESKKISARVKAGKKACAESGKFLGGVPNYGYRLGDGKLEVFEEEAKVVRMLFETYISDGNVGVINLFYKQGILKRGKPWTNTKVNKVIRNTIYRGQKQLVDGHIPHDENLRIVSDEVFYKAQDRMKARNSRTKGSITKHINKTDALLESIFYHLCGDGEIRKLHVDYSYRKYKDKRDDYKKQFYRCSHCKRYRYQEVKKTYGGIKYNQLVENEIKKILNDLSVEKLEEQFNIGKVEEIEKLEENIKDYEKNLQKKKLALENATKELEKAFIGESNMDLETLNNLIKKLKVDINDLENKLETNNNQLKQINLKKLNAKSLAEKYKDFTYLYDIADLNDKKKILQELVDKVIIYEDQLGEEHLEIRLNL